MKNLFFTLPLLAVILIFAGMALAAPLTSVLALPVYETTVQTVPMQGKGGKPAPPPTPTPTPKPRIGPPKSGDE